MQGGWRISQRCSMVNVLEQEIERRVRHGKIPCGVWRRFPASIAGLRGLSLPKSVSISARSLTPSI
jgi:hypothetical protein